jgi:hypothetical protein
MQNFIVEGADKNTGQPRRFGIRARDEMHAREWVAANESDVFVSAVRPATADESRLAPEPATPPIAQRFAGQPVYFTPRKAFEFGIYAALGILLVSLVAGLIVGLVMLAR